jgi:hypothetical protein
VQGHPKRRSSSLSVVESVGESGMFWAAAGMANESKTKVMKKPHIRGRGMYLLSDEIRDHGPSQDLTDGRTRFPLPI